MAQKRVSRAKLIVLFGIIFLLIFWVHLTNPLVTVMRMSSPISISESLLKTHVETLVGIHPHRSVQDWPSIDQAAKYIKSEWTKMGFQVEEQTYDVHGKSATNLVVKVSGGNQAEPGSADNPWVIIGAHYDVCMDLPGADDNASGVAGLLELSRALALQKPQLKHPLQLVAYTLEEPPYYDTDWMGSFVHAKRLRDSNQSVALMVSLEMIGYFKDEPHSQEYPVGLLKLVYPITGNFIAIVGHTQMWSATRRAKRQMVAATDLDVRSINTFSFIPGIDWSDHRSYWNFDYPAIMVTDTSFFRTPNYHRATDTVNTLNFARLAQVVQGIYGIATGY